MTAESEPKTRELIRKTGFCRRIDWTDTSIEPTDYPETDVDLKDLSVPTCREFGLKVDEYVTPDGEAENKTPS